MWGVAHAHSTFAPSASFFRRLKDEKAPPSETRSEMRFGGVAARSPSASSPSSPIPAQRRRACGGLGGVSVRCGSPQ